MGIGLFVRIFLVTTGFCSLETGIVVSLTGLLLTTGVASLYPIVNMDVASAKESTAINLFFIY